MKLCHNILALHNKSMSKKKVILIAVLMIYIYIYLSLSLSDQRPFFSDAVRKCPLCLQNDLVVKRKRDGGYYIISNH